MNQTRRYNTFSNWCNNTFGHPIHKICLDGGFTCPNRDGTVGVGGCIFCGERGAGEHVNARQTVTEQAQAQLDHYIRRKEKGGFVAYFQNFSNTYASVQELKEIYDKALISKRIEALAIATRPDCINEEVVSLLKEYNKERKVWVELGLQTSSDETALRINRGYKTEVCTRAVKLLKDNGIDVVIHIIFGLPGETDEDIKNTILYLNSLPIDGVKIHSLYVMKNTQLEVYYNENKYTTIDFAKYIDLVCYAISNLREDIVIHRLVGECMENLLVAPKWEQDKNAILQTISEMLEKEDIKQGDKKWILQ